MKWTTEAFIQRNLARVPGGEQVYYLGQRTLSQGWLRRFDISGKVRQGLGLLGAFYGAGEALPGRVAVELGTGWAPVVPLLFWLYGQAQCHTLDVSPLLREPLVVKVAQQLLAMLDEPQSLLRQWSLAPVLPERQQQLASLLAQGATGRAILQACCVSYHAPVDTGQTSFPAGSMDLVYSNTVLEHVPAAELPRLLAENYRLLRPGGHILHQIDLSDHFAHSDSTISAVNFLQFSQAEFARYNSPFLYQNRLRAPGYRALIPAGQFEITSWDTDLQHKNLAQLARLNVHPEFAHFSPEELCITGIRLVGRKIPYPAEEKWS